MITTPRHIISDVDDMISCDCGFRVTGFHAPEEMQKLNDLRDRRRQRSGGWWFRQMRQENKMNDTQKRLAAIRAGVDRMEKLVVAHPEVFGDGRVLGFFAEGPIPTITIYGSAKEVTRKLGGQWARKIDGSSVNWVTERLGVRVEIYGAERLNDVLANISKTIDGTPVNLEDENVPAAA